MWSKYTDIPASYLSNEQMGHATRKRYLSRQRPLLKRACAANAFYLCLNLLYFMHSVSEGFDETAQMHMLLLGFIDAYAIYWLFLTCRVLCKV